MELRRSVGLALLLCCAAPAQSSVPGAGVARTMHLLESSHAGHRKPVKILFYGQSITKQAWWKRVAADLRARYPNADLQIVNRAIGGFSTQYLKRTIEHDLFPFYPDLVIFHDYGSEAEYEEMIRAIRSRTTAEIALQTDHPAVKQKDEYHDRHSYEWMRDLALRYGLEWMEIRKPWFDYLQRNGTQPRALLRDNVHLNEQGDWLMAELVRRHLQFNPKAPLPETVRDYVVGEDVKWENGSLTLEFDGNRVELLTSTQDRQPYSRARIVIDGKRPSQLPEPYAIERPSDGTGPDWPLLIHIESQAPLQVEDWFIKVTEVSPDHKWIRFDLRGSQTGADGSGISNERFVSKSRRIVIDPSDWHFQRAYDLRKVQLSVGFEARFRVLPMFNDFYEPPRVDDHTREYSTLAASGLKNGPHKLELRSETVETPQITIVRVYRPPLR